MLRTRIITAVVGIPIVIAALWVGGWAWYALFAVMAVLGLYEYVRMLGQAEIQVPPLLSLLLMLTLLAGIGSGLVNIAVALFAGLALLVGAMVLAYPRFHVNGVAFGFFGAVYIGFNLAWGVRLEASPQAFGLMMFIFLLTWSSDIGGYFVGRGMGKRKLSPQLSPNKTWAGAIGGLLFSVLAAVLYCRLYPALGIGAPAAALFGAAGSVAAQFGDLFMSGVKRFCGVKDSGNILPGHGGILDRFDGFLLVLPLTCFLLIWQGVIPL